QRSLAENILGSLASFSELPKLREKARKEALEKTSILFCKSFAPGEIPSSEISLLSRLSLVQLLFAGADNVPFREIPEKALVASNAGGFAEPLAEHVLALALALGKKLMPLHNRMREGVFDSSEESLFFCGKVCGIIGYGGNGRAIGKLMKGLGMRVEGINRTGKPEAFCDVMGTWKNFHEMLPRWDVVVLTLPLTEKTRSIIGEEELQLMRKNAIFINVGRGALVEQGALYEHLRRFPQFLAGIDTWWAEPVHSGGFALEYPFLELPNLMASPHRADHVPEMSVYPMRKALENITAHLRGEPLRGVLRREEYLAVPGA
ncbi:MAG TPA: 2-hydroxyacid dehydrogenase, partial [Synergistaceae bacterium]|nr:2-hydroxyacid dehydrogenase [Synergistaceae bacterium]